MLSSLSMEDCELRAGGTPVKQVKLRLTWCTSEMNSKIKNSVSVCKSVCFFLFFKKQSS